MPGIAVAAAEAGIVAGAVAGTEIQGCYNSLLKFCVHLCTGFWWGIINEIGVTLPLFIGHSFANFPKYKGRFGSTLCTEG